MGTFAITIVGVGAHGCARREREGEKLHGRCGRISCPDCAAYEFVQRLRQTGMLSFPESKATFTHWPGDPNEVVDNMLTNVREKGGF